MKTSKEQKLRLLKAKIAVALPGFEPQWTVQRGIEELLAAYDAHGLTLEEFVSSRFQRIMRIRELLDTGELDEDLRRRAA